MSHDPLCPAPACAMTGRFRLLCEDCDLAHEECRCVCGLLARARAEERGRALDAARAAVLAYADDTHQHVGMLKCWPENGDRCDITAALRVAAQRIDALREEQAPPPLPPSVGVPSKPMWPLREEQK